MKVKKKADGTYDVELEPGEKQPSKAEVIKAAKKDVNVYEDLMSKRREMVRKAAERGDKEEIKRHNKAIERLAKMRVNQLKK